MCIKFLVDAFVNTRIDCWLDARWGKFYSRGKNRVYQEILLLLLLYDTEMFGMLN